MTPATPTTSALAEIERRLMAAVAEREQDLRPPTGSQPPAAG